MRFRCLRPWVALAQEDRREIDKLVVIVVNAANSPDTNMDQSAAVPGLNEVITSAATVPMDNYSVDSVKRCA